MPRKTHLDKFQAIPVGGIEYRTQVADYNGRKCPAHQFKLEVKKELIDSAAVEEVFDGNPTKIILQDEGKSFSVEFITTLGKYTVGMRTEGEDRIQYYSIPITAFGRDILDVEQLHDLWLENFLYVEITRHQLKLGDNVDPGKQDKKLAKKKDGTDDDPDQQGLDLGEGKDAQE